MQQGRFARRHLIGIAAVSVVAIALPMSVYAQDGRSMTIGRADLKALNGSNASGQAELKLSADGKELTVIIQAKGLEPGGVHLSHIHGLSENGQSVDSTCPSSAEDADGDGFVELAEGQVKYGPILLDFMNIDTGRDGHVNFKKTFDIGGSQSALPLQFRHIVVHGMTVGAVGANTPGEVDGTAGFKTVLPVLCGDIRLNGNADPLKFRKP
jgi:hypothetical protein